MKLIDRILTESCKPSSSLCIDLPTLQKGDLIHIVANNSERGEVWARWYKNITKNILAKVATGKEKKVILHGLEGDWYVTTVITRQT